MCRSRRSTSLIGDECADRTRSLGSLPRSMASTRRRGRHHTFGDQLIDSARFDQWHDPRYGGSMVRDDEFVAGTNDLDVTTQVVSKLTDPDFHGFPLRDSAISTSVIVAILKPPRVPSGRCRTAVIRSNLRARLLTPAAP